VSIGALSGHDGNGLSHSVSENFFLRNLDGVLFDLLGEGDDGLVDLDIVGDAPLLLHLVGLLVVLLDHALDWQSLGDVFCDELHLWHAGRAGDRHEVVTSTAVFDCIGNDRYLNGGSHCLVFSLLNSSL